MTRFMSRIGCIAAVGFLCFAVNEIQAEDWSKHKPTLSGEKWVVKRQYILPEEVFTKPDERIADFPTEGQAESYKKHMQKVEYDRCYPASMRFGYEVEERKNLDEKSVDVIIETSKSPIRPIDTKTVDLGPNKAFTAKKKLPLEGKTGKGKIGDSKVKVEFKKGGVVAISGDVEGEGKWDATENGVYFETKAAVFRGYMKGNTLTGQRFWKDNSVPMTKWEISLESSNGGSKFVGTWKGTDTFGVGRSYASTDEVEWIFNADKTGIMRNLNPRRGWKLNFTWSEQDDGVTFQFEKSDKKQVMKLSGMTLRQFIAKDPNVSGSDDNEILIKKE